MRAVALFAFASLAAAAAHADEWILQADLTPARLAERGAVLTSSDSVRWPNGPNVDLSYWLGDGDVVYRCAELAADDVTNASCWRLTVVAGDQSRWISTRRRPPSTAADASQPVAVQPYVWWNGAAYPPPHVPSGPPGPRPTPLPTPAP